MSSACHASKKLRYPRNEYRYLPSCLRKKLGERRDTIMSYPSTRSGLDRLEQAKLDQEMRREKIRLGEPLYEKVPLKGFAKWKKNGNHIQLYFRPELDERPMGKNKFGT